LVICFLSDMMILLFNMNSDNTFFAEIAQKRIDLRQARAPSGS